MLEVLKLLGGLKALRVLRRFTVLIDLNVLKVFMVLNCEGLGSSDGFSTNSWEFSDV